MILRLVKDGPKGSFCGECAAKARCLCDYIVKTRSGKVRFCDVPLCFFHATKVGADKHYCPKHAAKVPTGKAGVA